MTATQAPGGQAPTYPPTSTTTTTTTVPPTDPGTADTGGDIVMLGAIGGFFFVLFIGTALLRYLTDKWNRKGETHV